MRSFKNIYSIINQTFSSELLIFRSSTRIFINTSQNGRNYAKSGAIFAEAHPTIATMNTSIKSPISRTLINLLNCSREDAANILSKVPELESKTASAIRMRMNFLLGNNVTVASIKENPFLLVSRKMR